MLTKRHNVPYKQTDAGRERMLFVISAYTAASTALTSTTVDSEIYKLEERHNLPVVMDYTYYGRKFRGTQVRSRRVQDIRRRHSSAVEQQQQQKP